MLWTDKAKKILLKYWNFDKLKDKQISVINEILSGNDVIGLLPTGYGKSICYILPPLITKKTIFIISPLISLMDDQKDKLVKMGINVSALHCNNNNKEYEIKQILDGTIKIVYMSPEFIIDGYGLKLAKSLNDKNQLGYLAVDESHCLSSWGHDFRPQYLKLKEFRNLFPLIPIMAVTATAKEVVVKEIIKFLQLNKPQIIRANFDRPNLCIECKNIPKVLIKKKEKQKPYHELIIEYIDKYKEDRIIVYVNSRKETEDVSEKINEYFNKEISSSYHAGLGKKNRDAVQNNFISKECKVIISTIAFGMGIDQIVKCVLIIGCPSSIEEYYQQIGRGGRDGLPCETIFYYDLSKKIIRSIMIKKEQEQNSQTIKDKEQNSQIKLDNLKKIDANSKIKLDNLKRIDEYFYTKRCRRQYILDYLGLSTNYFAYNGFTCNNCDNCNNYNLIDITLYIWSGKVNKKIGNIIYLFNLTKILIDWKEYVKFKKYTPETLPENMKIKLRLDNDVLSEYDILYDKFDSVLDKII